MDYYAARIAGVRVVVIGGQRVEIHFEADGTHLYSTEEEDESSIPPAERVVRRVRGGRVEVRRFSVKRAQLLDALLPAIEMFTVSIPGTGASGAEKRMLHGRRLASGEYLRVVLRPGPGRAWTCVSAYPVAERAWLEAGRSKRAKFPPTEDE